MGTSVADLETAEKQGFDTGIRAVHPFDKSWKVPVYVANFILMDYGTGAIFGCPSGDQRDLDFAKKYELPFAPVILPPGEDAATFAIKDKAFDDDGMMINSQFLDGLSTTEAFEQAAQRLEKAKLGGKPVGKRKVNYRLRDWGISRQRYWGCPIPVIHCEACGVVPVPDDQLPVTLPDDATFDKPGNPLDRHPTWKYVTCPKCGARGARDRHHGHLRRQLVVLRALHRAARQDAGRQEGGGLLAARRPVHRRHRARDPASALLALLHPRPVRHRPPEADENVREPFAALFTQGMVTHETYKSKRGGWLLPGEVRVEGDGAERSAIEIATGEPAGDRRRREDVEVEQEHRRSRRPSSTSTAPTSRAGSCCPTARPSATSSIRTSASTARGASCSGSGGSSTRARSSRPPGGSPAGLVRPGGRGPAPGRPQGPRQGGPLNRGPALQRRGGPGLRVRKCSGLGPGESRGWEAGLRLGPARGPGVPGSDDRADDAAFGRGMLGAARIQHFAGQSSLAPADPGLLVDDTITIAVQVNGKRRDELTIADRPALTRSRQRP